MLTVDKVIDMTAEAFGMTRAHLCGRGLTPQRVRARQVAMYVADMETEATLEEIGAALGGRHHSTVLNGIRRAAQWDERQ